VFYRGYALLKKLPSPGFKRVNLIYSHILEMNGDSYRFKENLRRKRKDVS